MKLRTKITLTCLVLSLVPLTVMGYVAYQNGKQALKNSLGMTYELLAQQTINKIDRTLYEVYRDVTVWSELELMSEIAADDEDGKMTTFLTRLSQQYSYISSINAINHDGVIVASSHSGFIGQNFKKNPFFTSTMMKNPYFEDLYFDSIGKEWVISFSLPITAKFQKDKVLGVLNVRWKAEELNKLIGVLYYHGGEDLHARVLLVQDEGFVIFGPSSRQAGLFENLRINEDLRKAILSTSGENGYLIGPDEENKVSLIGYARSKGYRDFPGMGWRILVLEDLQTAFHSIDHFKMGVFGVGGIVACFVFIFSSWVARRMTQPILQISQAASRVAKGDFETCAGYEAKDEIGSLTQTFNQMIQDLKGQREQLVDKHYVDSIMANMMSSLIVIDLEGHIRRVNESTVALLGYSEEELLDEPIDEIFDGESPKTEVWIADLLEQGFLRNIETTYRAKDGRIIPVWFSCSVMRNAQDCAEGIVCVAQDITEHKQALVRLNHMANYDALTKLPNRALFLNRLTQLLSGAHRRKRIVVVLSLDLDRFKNINDTLGYVIGDMLLQEVSERLLGCVREMDTVARLGGDEFVFLLDDITRLEDAVKIAKKILEALRKPLILRGREFFISTSIGISLYPNDGKTVETLLKSSNTAMHRAKEQGGNNYQLFAAEMNVKAEEFLKLETCLRYALERDEFTLYYQPIVDCKTGRVVSMEVLLRWNHSELGMTCPAKFIPIAERMGLIGDIGQWVLKTACTQNKIWQELGFDPFRVAVNLSALQFDDQKLEHQVKAVLQETGLDPSCLELELTEGILMKNPEVTVNTLRAFHTLGIEISIDDFGTGYSSLNYLKRFPVNSLKIDQSFVQDLTHDPDDAAIVQAVIAMGHSLKLKIIAEGVETLAQLESLRAMQCDYIQGYLFSVPLCAEEITERLKKGDVFFAKEDFQASTSESETKGTSE